MRLVSLIVPIYNAEKYLDKCITSILNQTFTNFELILVNDGSTDASLSICTKYQKKDNRILVINKKNEGSIATRRKGVQAASSDYVMFVDADDWIDKKMIETLYTESINSSADITVCNMYKVLGNSKLIKRKNNSEYFKEDKLYDKEKIMNELIVAYFYGHPFPANLFGKLYKKDLLLNCGKFLEKIHFLGENLYYNLEIFLKTNRIKVINKPLYYYRAGGITSKYMPYFFDDIVNGYEIQKEVIDEYYIESKHFQYKGISIMLLNTFKTALNNLFDSDLKEQQIKDKIKSYVLNESIQEAAKNDGSISYFPSSFLTSIESKDIDYLYTLGYEQYKSSKPRKRLVNFITKISAF
ncbi:glycosyltransferase family 2 protein [Bacillus sp. AGMB 02131]|uniref:Glycosyltransferase family 2 protein n=1 Tax=Peribacillus faecalis TaxID=2772559 RepID=A0A927CU84_9BACI|nr:glycosyltransferase family 2 protein [Peribacillus faecalis]MBD3107668.1 glycosyltransferase family 2 protein [Peribacillus faecalis]